MDFSSMCPKFEKAAEILGRRWTGMIIRSLVGGPRRFSEITAYVPGLSDRLLSERLQNLKAAEIVERHVKTQRPVVITYALTDKGLALRRVVEALQEWADRWVPECPPVEASRAAKPASEPVISARTKIRAAVKTHSTLLSSRAKSQHPTTSSIDNGCTILVRGHAR